jgi:DNA polymerase elongation subunit (family B)
VPDSNGQYISLYGDKLKKVKYFKDLENVFEGDVNREIRTLVDRYYDSDEVSRNTRVAFFDIEVEVGDAFPDYKNPVNELRSFTLYDVITKTFHAYIVDPDNRVTLKSKNNTIIKCFQSEIELIYAFLDLLEEVNPTIISGWNSDYFDIPYLYNRIKHTLGYNKACSISPIGKVVYQERAEVYKIAGLTQIDYLKLYKKLSMGERPSYKLDAIGESEVGIKKLDYEGTLDDLWEQDRNRYLSYNINDVKILVELDTKLNYIDIARAICHKGHVPYEFYSTTSAVLDGAVLTYLKRKGIIAPNKDRTKTYDSEKENIQGAFVKVPQAGLHKWVFDIDATSMYPNVIMSLNLSPETKLGKVLNWNPKQFIQGKIEQYTVVNRVNENPKTITFEHLKTFLQDENISISGNGVMYRTDTKGLVPEILETWFDERVEFKRLRKENLLKGNKKQATIYNLKQYTQKILLNSFYGVLGSPAFRFYDLDNGNAVTSTSREMIRYAESEGNKFYNTKLNTVDKDYCIYIDTDSLFFPALPVIQKNNPDIDITDTDNMIKMTLEMTNEFQSYINNSLSNFSKQYCNIETHRFNFKQEVIAVGGFFVAKKRYGLWIVDEEGVKVDKLLVKGIDIVRSNFPNSFKVLFSSILKDILQGQDKDIITDAVKKFKRNIKSQTVEDIALNTSVQKINKFLTQDGMIKKGTPAHVRSAINYNRLLHIFKLVSKYNEIQEKDKIKWVYLKNNPYRFEKIAFKNDENPSEIMNFITQYIDINKIFQQAVMNKLQTFYDAMKWGRVNLSINTIDKFLA